MQARCEHPGGRHAALALSHLTVAASGGHWAGAAQRAAAAAAPRPCCSLEETPAAQTAVAARQAAAAAAAAGVAVAAAAAGAHRAEAAAARHDPAQQMSVMPLKLLRVSNDVVPQLAPIVIFLPDCLHASLLICAETGRQVAAARHCQRRLAGKHEGQGCCCLSPVEEGPEGAAGCDGAGAGGAAGAGEVAAWQPDQDAAAQPRARSDGGPRLRTAAVHVRYRTI